MSKIKINAQKKVNGKCNFRQYCITTTELSRVQPIFCREVIPGDSLKIDLGQINRLNPLYVPSFGEIHNKNAWFYVPNTSVWQRWNYFVSQSQYNVKGFGLGGEMINNSPYIRPWEILCLLSIGWGDFLQLVDEKGNQAIAFEDTYANAESSFAELSSNEDAKPDVIFYNFYPRTWASSSTSLERKWIAANFNEYGRRIFTILRNLGYQCSLDYRRLIPYSGSYWYNNRVKFDNASMMSLFPLVAFASVYCEYFIPKKYQSNLRKWLDNFYNSSSSDFLFSYPSQTDSSPYWDYTNIVTSNRIIYDNVWKPLFDELSYIYYDSDFFTEALEQPNLVNGASNPASLIDSINVSPVGSTDSSDNVTIENTSNGNVALGSSSSVSAYGLAMLNAVTNFVLKHNLVGGSVADKLRSMVGISSNVNSRLPRLLKSSFDSVYSEDIISQSDTQDGNGNGKSLGYNGGRLDFGANTSLSFKSDDYGMLLCINAITPDYFYYQGLHREMMHHSIFDGFFNPSFVSVGAQAISNMEIYNDGTLNFASSSGQFSYLFNTFGYSSRYYEYMTPKNTLSGSFYFNSLNTGSNVWHFGRMVVDADANISSPISVYNFMTAQFARQNISSNVFESASANYRGSYILPYTQYNRIFQDGIFNVDHIVQFNIFKVCGNRPVQSVYDMRFGEFDDTSIDLGSQSKVMNS